VGGYADTNVETDKSAQFDIDDNRTLDEIVAWLLQLGYIPSFCTACYREGRTGDRFMSLAKRGMIGNCCAPNALMTLREYIEDYASPTTRQLGLDMIAREINNINSEKIRQLTLSHLNDIAHGKRDFRF
jgi:2-iminoacetate synthase